MLEDVPMVLDSSEVMRPELLGVFLAPAASAGNVKWSECYDLQKELLSLVFVGSPLLDITTCCDRATLDEYDLPEDGCVRATHRHDRLFETLFGDPRSRLDAGGSALNSAKIAKWILGDRGHVSFAGCTGSDAFSSELRKDLLSWGVRPLFVTLPDHPTGVCACLLSSDGKRSMCTRLGAAALFSRAHLETTDVKRSVEGARCVFVVGYFLAHSPDVVRTLADGCSPSQDEGDEVYYFETLNRLRLSADFVNERGGTKWAVTVREVLFSLSLSAEYICREHRKTLLGVLPRVDIFLGNEAEVEAFASAVGLEQGVTTEEAACAFAKIGRSADSATPRIVVVTRGPDPVIVVRGHESPRYFHVPRDVTVVDSVGCGDALAGAFLANYAVTGEIDRAVEAGIRASVEIAQVPGCNPPLKDVCNTDDGNVH